MFVSTNTFKAIKDYFVEGLTPFYEVDEINILFEITSEHFLGWSKVEQKMKLESHLSESELLDFHFTLKRLKLKEPIQYILEDAPFMGLNFRVTKDTLIPRPETEELVDLILKSTIEASTVLDIGTGSGCIPIALKHHRPVLQVYATDVSKEALMVAEENATKNNTKILFGAHDILSEDDLPNGFPSSFDIIVSNPPYVTQTEQKDMEDSVLDFEPHLALFVENEDPLLFYRHIASRGLNLLRSNGELYFEINQYHAEATKNLILEIGYSSASIIVDINNNPRMIHAKK